MSAVGLLALGAGLLLLWSAIRGDDPREIIAGVIRPSSTPAATGNAGGKGIGKAI